MDYDGQGRLTRYREEGKENEVDFSREWSVLAFDESGRVERSVEEGRMGELAYKTEKSDIIYNPRSLVASYVESGGQIFLQYDGIGRPHAVRHSFPEGPFDFVSLSFDAFDRVTVAKESDSKGTDRTVRTFQITYSSQNQPAGFLLN
jgi:hypothetical protein